MSLKSRIERLEKKLGKPGECCCEDKLVIHYPETPAPDPYCAVCKGNKKILTLRYEKNWRGIQIEHSEPIEPWRYALPVNYQNDND